MQVLAALAALLAGSVAGMMVVGFTLQRWISLQRHQKRHIAQFRKQRMQVLATLAALLAGNEANRARLAHDVGYDTLLTVLTARMGPRGAPQGVLQQVLALALEVRAFSKGLGFRV